jgi:hypothetical protein
MSDNIKIMNHYRYYNDYNYLSKTVGCHFLKPLLGRKHYKNTKVTLQYKIYTLTLTYLINKTNERIAV